MAQNEPQNGRNQSARGGGTQQQGREQEREQRGLARGGGGAGLGRGGPGIQTPFSFVRRMFEDMDRLFGEFGMGGGLAPASGYGFAPSLREWVPQLEVFEQGDELVVRADLPGMKKEDVKLELKDDVLVISGERREEQRDEREGFFRSERSYGCFERAIRVPEGTDPASCEARFDNGVLEVKLKMPEQPSRARQIPIQASGETVSEKTKKS
ncbi:Hsp20/alpha crystallin family protein [Sandaracinus amylolyticus]|uniref:Hsp20/alpha crystallin family protein n=1 Tax=Sandaracinus amylolyticus TaxID=927083 RepID=UPI001F30BD1B|nr:Hsp20/alpha crystallin family protein [Sandaracinus amylolyticus]UJR79620.1 Molecular chaperone (Small heat shock protein) [Sandaracinus amylolyticus]